MQATATHGTHTHKYILLASTSIFSPMKCYLRTNEKKKKKKKRDSDRERQRRHTDTCIML